MTRSGTAEPVVLDWIILKIVQRCNLNCTYCYVYNRGDESWKTRPPVISDAVLLGLAKRITEHCLSYSLSGFTLELHGGEPLLLGKRRMQRLIDLLRHECAPIELHITLQTNGLLLDHAWLELFAANHVQFGLSIDAPPPDGGDKRVFRNGRGSTTELISVIEKLRAESSLFQDINPGILCVVDPRSDGAQVVRWLVQHGFMNFDLLLPDGTHVNRPDGWAGPEPYQLFLLRAFEEWSRMGKMAPRIRFFEVMMQALMGVRPGMDYLGGDVRRLCVVESDGSMGLSDLIRICGGRYAYDELNVFENRLDEVAPHYELEALQQPCEQCQNCRYFEGCRGGLLAHRYDGRSFANPSIYCDALYSLAEAVFCKLRAALPPSAWVDPADRPTIIAS